MKSKWTAKSLLQNYDVYAVINLSYSDKTYFIFGLVTIKWTFYSPYFPNFNASCPWRGQCQKSLWMMQCTTSTATRSSNSWRKTGSRSLRRYYRWLMNWHSSNRGGLAFPRKIYFPTQKCLNILLRVSCDVICPSPVISERLERTRRRSSAMRSDGSWDSNPLITRWAFSLACMRVS